MNGPVSGYLFALGAGASYGLAQVLTRQGVTEYTTPLAGVTVSLFFGMVGMSLLIAKDLRTSFFGRNFPRGALLFTLAGLAGSGGVLINYIALSVAPVVVVSPVLGVNPLVTLVLAAIFLRGLERVTRRLMIGSGLVVVGVVCISLATTLHL